MFADERQNKIYEILKKKQAITTVGLVKEFGVSVETIRRDLLAMEKKQLLRRVHGGAMLMIGMQEYNSLNIRNEENSDKKLRLSKKAAEFIEEGDFIAVDSGSTAIIFAEVIKEKFSSLTVVTHSLDVFNILAVKDGFKVILCGGEYLKSENTFFGSLTADSLSQLYVRKAFIFPTSISMEFGIGDFRQELLLIQRVMKKHSDKVYILADSSKFEKKSLLKQSEMEKEYAYITDNGLSNELYELYTENGYKIYMG